MNATSKFRLKNTSAFTLVELLVVISIIGVLIGMLLPAVQMVRESARRTSCLNNLKQISLAVQSFHDARRMIPPARGADKYLTWPVYILPQLEQQNLFDNFDLKMPYADQNPEAIQKGLDVFICPSRRTAGQLSVAERDDAPLGAVGDYAGNAGTSLYFNPPFDDWAQFEKEVDGVFNSGYATANPINDGKLVNGGKGRYRLKDILDGLSNTIFVGEKAINVNFQGEPSGWGDNCFYNGDEPFAFIRLGGPLMPIESGTQSYSGQIPVFGSSHATICNFGFGDGSVKRLRNEIDEETLRRLCSRNDGLAISID